MIHAPFRLNDPISSLLIWYCQSRPRPMQRIFSWLSYTSTRWLEDPFKHGLQLRLYSSMELNSTPPPDSVPSLKLPGWNFYVLPTTNPSALSHLMPVHIPRLRPRRDSNFVASCTRDFSSTLPSTRILCTIVQSYVSDSWHGVCCAWNCLMYLIGDWGRWSWMLFVSNFKYFKSFFNKLPLKLVMFFFCIFSSATTNFDLDSAKIAFCVSIPSKS